MEMRIRALTLFLSFSQEDDISVIEERLEKASQILGLLKQKLESRGFIVISFTLSY